MFSALLGGIALVVVFAVDIYTDMKNGTSMTARRALEGADVAHLMLPMPFEIKVKKIAAEMGVPCTAAFHI